MFKKPMAIAIASAIGLALSGAALAQRSSDTTSQGSPSPSSTEGGKGASTSPESTNKSGTAPRSDRMMDNRTGTTGSSRGGSTSNMSGGKSPSPETTEGGKGASAEANAPNTTGKRRMRDDGMKDGMHKDSTKKTSRMQKNMTTEPSTAQGKSPSPANTEGGKGASTTQESQSSATTGGPTPRILRKPGDRMDSSDKARSPSSGMGAGSSTGTSSTGTSSNVTGPGMPAGSAGGTPAGSVGGKESSR